MAQKTFNLEAYAPITLQTCKVLVWGVSCADGGSSTTDSIPCLVLVSLPPSPLDRIAHDWAILFVLGLFEPFFIVFKRRKTLKGLCQNPDTLTILKLFLVFGTTNRVSRVAVFENIDQDNYCREHCHPFFGESSTVYFSSPDSVVNSVNGITSAYRCRSGATIIFYNPNFQMELRT